MMTASENRELECCAQLAFACDSRRHDASSAFTKITHRMNGELHRHSHTRSGWGSTTKGAFETIAIWNPKPKFRELNITVVADAPSGDCGWQFAMYQRN